MIDFHKNAPFEVHPVNQQFRPLSCHPKLSPVTLQFTEPSNWLASFETIAGMGRFIGQHRFEGFPTRTIFVFCWHTGTTTFLVFYLKRDYLLFSSGYVGYLLPEKKTITRYRILLNELQFEVWRVPRIKN